MDNKDSSDKSLVKSIKDIQLREDKSDYIDTKVISRKFYNSFNYSRLPSEAQVVNLSLGITSPKRGAGKTLVASNLAVSLASGHERKTVLVDMSFSNPEVHKVFNVNIDPGINEAFSYGTIHLIKTKIENLYILTAGRSKGKPLKLKDISSFREVMHSLKEQFEFIIIDMNSVMPAKDFPSLIANEVDGMLVVVDSKHTKMQELEKMFQHLNENHVMGFIMNRVNDK